MATKELSASTRNPLTLTRTITSPLLVLGVLPVGMKDCLSKKSFDSFNPPSVTGTTCMVAMVQKQPCVWDAVPFAEQRTSSSEQHQTIQQATTC